MFKSIKYILYTIYISITEGYTYHASSLTYSFIMVLGSLILFSSFLASFLPFFDFNKIINYAVLLFPEQAERVILEILKVYQHRTSGSILSFAVAYFFSVSFSKSLHRAFLYVLSEVRSEKEWVFWVKTPALVLLYTLCLSLLFFLSSFLKVYLGNYNAYLFYFINLLTFWVLIFLTYTLFLPRKYSFKDVYVGAMLSSCALLLFNKLFSAFVVKLVALNPLYSFMGSVLIFFIWVNLSFSVLLAGAKYIQLMKEKE